MICKHPSGQCLRPVQQGKLGYCSMHYSRLHRKGDVGGLEPLRKATQPDGACSHPNGCTRLVMAKGLCGMHYNRTQKGLGLGPADGWDVECGQCHKVHNTIYTFAVRCPSCADNPRCFSCERPTTTHSGKLCGKCRAWVGAIPCVSAECPNLAHPGSKSGLCKSCVRRGSLSPNWKGGRTTNQDGYVRVAAPEDYKGTVHNGYVHEHRMVMEQSLGRLLVRHETVHHKNGDRSDNRIENLELWSKSQPAGQRVKDKVQWAKEMLWLYEPEALTQEERNCHRR